MSLRTAVESLTDAVARLTEAGIETARHDAEWILASVLRVRRGALVLDRTQTLDDDEAKAFDALIERRASREPLGYVLGTVVFRGLELECGPGVLVPRPETEITAERAILRARERGRTTRATIVDVGTGCAPIALSLAAEVPDARIFATEIAAAARGWALRNLARTGLRCTLLPGDLLSPLHPALGGCVDVIVSNPPYVPDDEWDGLEPEIKRFEPRGAVCSGPMGLEVIANLAESARPWLAHGGWLVIEIGETQGEAVEEILQATGYGEVTIHRDLTGRDRVAEGCWLRL